MSNLLKLEAFRLRKNKSIWIILFIIVAACSISIFTDVYTSAEHAYLNIQKDIMTIILPCAVFSGLAFYSDFTERTILHYITKGYKRKSIILASYARYIVGCLIITVLYPIISTMLAGIINGVETSMFEVAMTLLKSIFLSIPLYLSIFSLFFLVVFAVRQSVICMSITVGLAIFIVVFTNKAYFGTSGETIIRLSPIILIQNIQNNFILNDYLIGITFSILCSFIMIIIAFVIFKQSDIK